VVACNRENTYRFVHLFIRLNVNGHQDDGGSDDGVNSLADAVDDLIVERYVVFLVEDFDAVDGGFLCNAKVVTSDYGSEMGAIWKGEVRQLSLRTR
jgi:hypothetical protein